MVAPPATEPLGATLLGIAGGGAANVWAVGQLGSQHPAPVIERWDGAAWTISPSPPTPFYGNLEGISALSVSDIWAVGFQGVTSLGTTLGGLTLGQRAEV